MSVLALLLPWAQAPLRVCMLDPGERSEDCCSECPDQSQDCCMDVDLLPDLLPPETGLIPPALMAGDLPWIDSCPCFASSELLPRRVPATQPSRPVPISQRLAILSVWRL